MLAQIFLKLGSVTKLRQFQFLCRQTDRRTHEQTPVKRTCFTQHSWREGNKQDEYRQVNHYYINRLVLVVSVRPVNIRMCLSRLCTSAPCNYN